MRKKQQLITLRQLEDWLIYHCPLQRAAHWNMKNSPFKVEVQTDHPGVVGCICYHETPWEAYAGLARIVYGHEPTLEYVTRMYYQS